MASAIILLALGLLFLPYVNVSPPIKGLRNPKRDATPRPALDHKLKTPFKHFPPNFKGFNNDLGDKTPKESIGHKLKSSSKLAPPSVYSFTNDHRGTPLRQSMSRRQKTSLKLIPRNVRNLTNNQRNAKPEQSSESRQKTVFKRNLPALRRRPIKPIYPRLNTSSLYRGTKPELSAQDSKTSNQLIGYSEYASTKLHDAANNTSSSPRQSGPVKANHSPINVPHSTKIGRAKMGPRNYTDSRKSKGKQHILQDGSSDNPMHDNFRLSEDEGNDNTLSYQRGKKKYAKAISVSQVGFQNLVGSDSNRSRSKTFTLQGAGQIYGDTQAETHKPKLNGPQNTIDEYTGLLGAAGTETVNLQSYKATNVREHSHDTFRCGRSNCKCSYTHKGKIIAECTSKHITRFPLDLPSNTWQLSLLENRMKLMNMTHLATYPSLFKLQISENSLKNIDKSVENMTSLLTELNLSKNIIESLADNSFEIMPHLLTLNLAHNRIQAITNLTFSGLDSLRILNLSNNILTHIDFAAFDSLRELRTLDLSRNLDLSYDKKVFSPRLMKPLKKLQYLLLYGSSSQSYKYPSKTLQQLTNLQRLSINGLHGAIFGHEISTLKHLTHIDLGFYTGYCQISEITEVFFQNLPYLHTLTLTYCNKLKKIESTIPGKPLCKTMRRLRIAYNFGYDLTTALSDLKAFQNSSLQALEFVALYPHEGWLPCRFLRGDDAFYLQNLQLEELDLSNNRLSLLDSDFLSQLPSTLKRLILNNNKFTSDGISLNKLSFLNELVEIDISYQNMAKPFIPLGNMNSYQTDSKYPSTPENVFHTQKTAVSTADSKQRSQYISKNKTVSTFPPNLHIIRATHHNSFGMRILFRDSKSKNTFKEVYFSNSFLTKLSLGSLPPSIQIADLSNNFCDKIGTRFFQPNNSLVYLSLHNNFLGGEFGNDTNGSIFALLTNTKYLDLRYNVIYNLPRHFFSGLGHLETLILSDNKIQVLDTRFSHITSLQTLNLRKNAISWISRGTRDDFDILAASHPLQVDLTLNPLPCTCDGLELINWMSVTNVHFTYKDDLKCRLGDGKTVDFGDLQERSRSLQRHCASKPLIIVICAASICVMAILVGFCVLYRYRWKLRYFRHIVLMRMVGFKPRQNQGLGYKFDAYVLYTEETRRFVHVHFLQELEKKRNHRLCISERDFLPGTYDISNIVSAIQNSTKTVVVVTPDLYKDEFSEYGIKMAIMEELYKNRNVLHLCVYQPMPPDNMASCHDLLMVMKRNHYTEYPPDDQATEEICQNFWDQLSLAIGHEHDPQVPAELELR